jgi:hypothetical protein
MLTEKQSRALAILTEHPYITARMFGEYYFDSPEHGYLHTAVSNQGEGACAGKKAWLCAGSLLGKLRKEGYVNIKPYSNPNRFYVTEKGLRALKETNKN